MSAHENALRAAWQRHVGTGAAARTLFDSLLARHREPHRRYHGVAHVGWVVRHAIALAGDREPDPAGREPGAAPDLAAIVVAAFFHDAIYLARPPDAGSTGDDPATRGGDEEASAQLARRELAGLDDPAWSPARVERVVEMIRATAHLADVASRDDAPTVDVATAILLDADLAVLGADPAAYDAYARGVRAEYRHVDDAGWRAGRRAVLETFLGRPSIYLTDEAQQRWEHAARANLAAELAALGDG